MLPAFSFLRESVTQGFQFRKQAGIMKKHGMLPFAADEAPEMTEEAKINISPFLSAMIAPSEKQGGS